MATQYIRRPFWQLELDWAIRSEWLMGPSVDEDWRETDSHGHEHRWDHGYPTLDLVVDASHWCDGTEGIALHDPHRCVDESHYECRQCEERITPRLHSGGRMVTYPGPVRATLQGTIAAGKRGRLTLTMEPTDEDVERLLAAQGAAADEIAAEILGLAPRERVWSYEHTLG